MTLPGFEYSDLKIYFEEEFINFFHKIFESEIFQSDDILNIEVLNKVKTAYSTQSIKSGASHISFSSPATRCAYIFQYAPCFASTVAFAFQKLLKGNPWLFERVMLQDTVTICLLGGGPATEFIAIAKILEQMMWRYCPRGERPMIVDAIIIDADSGWAHTAQFLLPYISSLLATTIMKFRLSFIQADLEQPFNEDVKNAIMRADIVTMVKFLSAVSGRNAKDKIAHILQETVDSIRPGSILFFLDSSGFQHYDVVATTIHSSYTMFHIYGDLEYNIYTMSPYSLMQFSRLYRSYFGKRQCSQSTKNCIRVWYKMPQNYNFLYYHPQQLPSFGSMSQSFELKYATKATRKRRRLLE